MSVANQIDREPRAGQTREAKRSGAKLNGVAAKFNYCRTAAAVVQLNRFFFFCLSAFLLFWIKNEPHKTKRACLYGGT